MIAVLVCVRETIAESNNDLEILFLSLKKYVAMIVLPCPGPAECKTP